MLRLRQALGPATPPTTSAAPCVSGKSDTDPKKRNIDWPQDFVPGTSINPEFNSLDLPSFVAGYLAMICTYDTASNAHMLAILDVLMTKAISYTWASVRGFYSYLARQVELRRLDWDPYRNSGNGVHIFQAFGFTLDSFQESEFICFFFALFWIFSTRTHR